MANFTEITEGTLATPANLNAPLHQLAETTPNVINVKGNSYGAVGNGVDDDTTAILNAITAARTAGRGIVYLPPGKYRVTSEIVVPPNVVLSGTGSVFYQTIPSDVPAEDDVTWLYYDGAGGTNSCVVRVSTEVVGTRPVFTDPNTSSTFGSGVENLYIDGNGLAEFGLYGARCGLGTYFRNIVVANTKKHGVWLGELWTTKVERVYAIHNYGRGVTIGEDTFSWGANAVNACHFDTIQGYNNGRDGTFDATTAPTDGCGIYVGAQRANVFTNLIGEENDGAGVVIATRSGPNIFNGIYVEGNDPTTNYGIIIDGQGSAGAGTSVHLRLNGVYTQSGQKVWLTGEPPVGYEAGVVIDGIYGSGVIEADWNNYEIRNTHVLMSRDIVGELPGNNTYYARGTAVIPAISASTLVNHGLAVQPNVRDIYVTPLSSWGSTTQWWVTQTNATTFSIILDQAPTASALTFGWAIRTRPNLAPEPEP